MKKSIGLIHKEVKRHSLDYIFLATISVIFLVLLQLFKGEKTTQFVILTAYVSFYILWGIYHHASEDNLHLKVVVEYVLFGFTILFLLKILVLP